MLINLKYRNIIKGTSYNNLPGGYRVNRSDTFGLPRFALGVLLPASLNGRLFFDFILCTPSTISPKSPELVFQFRRLNEITERQKTCWQQLKTQVACQI